MTSIVEKIKIFIEENTSYDYLTNFETLKQYYDEDYIKFTLLTEFDIDIDMEIRKDIENKEKRFYQKKLRKESLNMYNNKCIISDNKEDILLEVAHIVPVSECDNNSEKGDVYNTLLLWVDIHRFFDKYLISINPETGIVITNCDYLKQFNGKYIVLNNKTQKYMKQHYNKFVNINKIIQ
jgi:hypothetical protein